MRRVLLGPRGGEPSEGPLIRLNEVERLIIESPPKSADERIRSGPVAPKTIDAPCADSDYEVGSETLMRLQDYTNLMQFEYRVSSPGYHSRIESPIENWQLLLRSKRPNSYIMETLDHIPLSLLQRLYFPGWGVISRWL